MKQYQITLDNVLDFAKNYTGEKFHALLCDPPYELGFMGKGWDNSGVAFNPETWRLLAQHLLPGGFGMAFASSRGWHRMAVAIEDAGLIIHPSIFGWGFGSGFPKATRIDTQIDKAAGKFEEREVVGFKQPGADKPENSNGTMRLSKNTYQKNGIEGCDITKPATPLAQAFEGHRYGRQAMKPALEPIILFQKPYAGRPIDSIVETGAGALNIDGGRIPANENLARLNSHSSTSYGGGSIGKGANNAHVTGTNKRWPANLILTHHPNCNGVCVEDCPVRRIGEQGRYFFNADYTIDKLEAADPVFYCAKASRAERDAGLEAFELVKAHLAYGDFEGTPDHATNKNSRLRNPHPTVKPIKLIQHLATLLLPPDIYAPRRLLIPFSGSGSEMIGAILAGWEMVHGVELNEEYRNIALARLKHWVGWAKTDSEPSNIIKVEKPEQLILL